MKKDLVMGEKYKNYIELKVIQKKINTTFIIVTNPMILWELFDTANSNLLLSEGYTGTHIGLYVTSNGKKY